MIWSLFYISILWLVKLIPVKSVESFTHATQMHTSGTVTQNWQASLGLTSFASASNFSMVVMTSLSSSFADPVGVPVVPLLLAVTAADFKLLNWKIKSTLPYRILNPYHTSLLSVIIFHFFFSFLLFSFMLFFFFIPSPLIYFLLCVWCFLIYFYTMLL